MENRRGDGCFYAGERFQCFELLDECRFVLRCDGGEELEKDCRELEFVTIEGVAYVNDCHYDGDAKMLNR
jgi:hypothetical protein